MFVHAGMLELVPEVTAEQQQYVIDGFGELEGRIDGLVQVEVCRDLGLSEDNAQLLCLLSFQDQLSWQRYRDHPAHQALIAERIAPVLRSKSFVQYER